MMLELLHTGILSFMDNGLKFCDVCLEYYSCKSPYYSLVITTFFSSLTILLADISPETQIIGFFCAKVSLIIPETLGPLKHRVTLKVQGKLSEFRLQR